MRRVVAFALVGFVLIALLGALLQAFGVRRLSVDVGLIIVLHIAMLDRRGGVYRAPVVFGAARGMLDGPGVATALSLGYLADVVGGGVKGLHSLELGVAFIAARLMARQVFLSGALSQLFITFAAALSTSTLALGVWWLLGTTPTLSTVGVLLARAVITAALAPPLMRILRVIDSWLYREGSERGSLRLR